MEQNKNKTDKKDESKVEFGSGNKPSERIPSTVSPHNDQKENAGGNTSIGGPGTSYPRVEPGSDNANTLGEGT